MKFPNPFSRLLSGRDGNKSNKKQEAQDDDLHEDFWPWEADILAKKKGMKDRGLNPVMEPRNMLLVRYCRERGKSPFYNDPTFAKYDKFLQDNGFPPRTPVKKTDKED